MDAGKRDFNKDFFAVQAAAQIIVSTAAHGMDTAKFRQFLMCFCRNKLTYEGFRQRVDDQSLPPYLLSDIEVIEFSGIGDLECSPQKCQINTAVVQSVDVAYMKKVWARSVFSTRRIFSIVVLPAVDENTSVYYLRGIDKYAVVSAY